ncbi:uncharacterized protein LOC111276238 [Durio zibethinus]|uniref:Uncharacterized protein LOC111276238 n=1 Tax=Durio zibethinus TaxID=66656 RepID=A0A6P5WPU1_DURZI|nr:uncharacterized protein LOC111276238 [Durio zibethinus]
MAWTKEYLDLVLVPSGLLIMSAYHVFLLYRCLKLPQTTVIGYENHCRKAWVERMLQVEAKDIGLALTTINSTISASTFLATVSLTLSSLIGTWLADSSHNLFRNNIPASYVQKAVIRGSACWSIGLRAIYLATTLLLWIFGPIPMFAASVIMVVILHMLDRNATPLHKFEPANSHNQFTKIRGELAAVASTVIEHHDR